jgi:hypothetical protein
VDYEVVAVLDAPDQYLVPSRKVGVVIGPV